MQAMASLATPAKSGGDPKPVLTESRGSTDQETLQSLRRFHLTGPQGEEDGAWLDRDILPALLHGYRDPGAVRTAYPLFLSAGDGRSNPSCLPLPDFLDRLAPPENESRILHDNLLRLERGVREATASGRPRDAREVFGEAGQALREDLGLGGEDNQALEAGLNKLMAAIPEDGKLVPLDPASLFDLFRLAAEGRLTSLRSRFAGRIGEIAEKTRARLETDRLKHPGAQDQKAMKAKVGKVGARFFDASAMADVIRASGEDKGLPKDRRVRCQTALEFLEDLSALGPDRFVLVHDGSLSPDLEKQLDGWKVERSEDPCRTAEERFDQAAEAMAGVLRAERVARLEYEDQYDPQVHDLWLSRYSWTGFSTEDLRLIPPVVAVLSSDHVARHGLLSLSRLVLSGRPVHVLVLDHPARNPGEEGWSGFRFEAGYLALSHREAWVQQTSVARPHHLMEGFVRALEGSRTAVHVIASGFDHESWRARLGPWFYAGAAVESRAFACFHYDPEAGNSWARRLDFTENPQPEATWPSYELVAKTESGEETTLSLPFTFADFALLDPDFTGQFRLMPESVPEGELVTLDAYLDLPVEEAVRRVPFVWGVDGMGKLRRLAVTRRLALASRDRLGYWRTLQELAGVRNEYADEAARAAREAAEAVAAGERQELENRHHQELEQVRETAMEDAVNQLTAALLEVDISDLPAPGFSGAFRGMSVDEVAKVLLDAVRPEDLETSDTDPKQERVEQAAHELLGMIDPDRLEENSK